MNSWSLHVHAFYAAKELTLFLVDEIAAVANCQPRACTFPDQNQTMWRVTTTTEERLPLLVVQNEMIRERLREKRHRQGIALSIVTCLTLLAACAYYYSMSSVRNHHLHSPNGGGAPSMARFAFHRLDLHLPLPSDPYMHHDKEHHHHHDCASDWLKWIFPK
jgi:hypothetical protein